eukprot:9700429-Heterocapsa_arctica.AAC.1
MLRATEYALLKIVAPYLQPCLPPTRMDIAVSMSTNENHDLACRFFKREMTFASTTQCSRRQPWRATYVVSHLHCSEVRPSDRR